MSRSSRDSDDGVSNPGDYDDPPPFKPQRTNKDGEEEGDDQFDFDDLEGDDDFNDPDVNPDVINDEDSDGDSYASPKVTVASVRRQWHAEVRSLRESHAGQMAELQREIDTLEDRIVRLERRGRIEFEPWIPRLHSFLKDNPRLPKDEEYQRLYKVLYEESCRQGIMSRSSAVHHPDLIINKKYYSERHIRKSFDHWRLSAAQYRRLSLIILPNLFSQRLPIRFLPGSIFRFGDLPREIQWKILKKVFPTNEIIHCLSRLDPYNPPLDFTDPALPLNRKGHSVGSGYPNRFHIGKGPCSIVKAAKPNDVIGYFLVCKRWYFLGAHLFYGTNTFAFSSLGEFGRFCNGIKKARVQRLVNVEIMWRGSLMPRQDNKISLRNITLTWLMRASRLRTLVVHINESSKNYMRRAYEMFDEADYERDFGPLDESLVDPFVRSPDMTQSMTQSLIDNTFSVSCNRTDTQPNFRKNRNMRTLQGADNFWCLRGMKWIRFYDVDAGPATRRTHIRDWSFAEGVNNVVTLPKCRRDALLSELENLMPFTGLEIYEYSDEDMELVRRLYDIDVNKEPSPSSRSESCQSSVSLASSPMRDVSPPTSLPSSPPPPRVAKMAADAKIEKVESGSDSNPSTVKQRRAVVPRKTAASKGRAPRKGNNARKRKIIPAFVHLNRPSMTTMMARRQSSSMNVDSDDDKYRSETEDDQLHQDRGPVTSKSFLTLVDLTQDGDDRDSSRYELVVRQDEDLPQGSAHNRRDIDDDESLFVREGPGYAQSSLIGGHGYAQSSLSGDTGMFVRPGSQSAHGYEDPITLTSDESDNEDEVNPMDVDFKDSTSASKSKTMGVKTTSDDTDVKTDTDIKSDRDTKGSIKKESSSPSRGLPTVVSPRTLFNQLYEQSHEGDKETIVIPSDTEDEADDEAEDETDEEGLVADLAKHIKNTQEIIDVDDDDDDDDVSIVIPSESSWSKQPRQDVSSPSIAGYTTTTTASKRGRDNNDTDKDDSPSKRQKLGYGPDEQADEDGPTARN
ncbi:hypothetical protein GGR57DRAFT_513586 [Xylariaceae sp. FL1272]|nr:hypothetical protein GGR57DRAFT_513586 [Xylariaceae sp. FL1272]